MLYLYLDESGDLGFDFLTKRPTNYFTIVIVSVNGQEHNRALSKAVSRTIRHKLSPTNAKRISELKGTSTTYKIKEYFMKQAYAVPLEIYALTLNKRRVNKELAQVKDRLYNYVARLVLEKLPIGDTTDRVHLIIDRSKGKKEIDDFNRYIVNQLSGRLDPKVPLEIFHWRSHESAWLQAADLFSWGIFRKYEKNDTAWFDCFKQFVKFDTVYLK